MFHRKLLEILQNFSPTEHKRLKIYLQSPYFNKGIMAEQLLALYEYTRKFQFDENHPQLSKASVFQHLFPNLAFVENEKNSLDSLSSELFQLVKQFISQIQFEHDFSEEKEMVALAAFYRRFNMRGRFSQNYTAFQKLQASQKGRGYGYFLYKYLMELEETQFQRQNISFETDESLMAVHKSLDLYYLIQKLDLLCALEQQGRFLQINLIDTPITQAIRNQITGDEYPESAIIRIFLHILRTIHSSLVSDFEALEKMIQAYSVEINSEYQQVFYSYLRFFWSRYYTQTGSEQARQKMFDLYKDHFSKGFFYQNNLIQANALRAMLNLALKMGHFDWIKQVLDQHPPEKIGGTRYAAEIHNMNYAEYYFYLKQYDIATEHLIYRNFENPTYSILADVLLIKIYYETENELCAFRIHSMRQKVSRSKLSAEIKERYNNFLNKMDKLVKYGWIKKNPKLAKIREEVRTISNIIEREWLMEKLSGY